LKFSARVSYGLRAAIALAGRAGEGPTLGKDISESEGLPPAYLEQIMASLRRADIVSGTRGAKGGYTLTRTPESITVTELISALEGPIQLSECPDGPSCCDRPETCVINSLYQDAEKALLGVFDERRLSDLLAQRRALHTDAQMYDI
jgi:Rrf2 family protein